MRTATGKRKKYNLDRVVHSQSETICKKWHHRASEYIGHIVSVRSTVLTKSRWRFLKRWGCSVAIRVSVPSKLQ